MMKVKELIEKLNEYNQDADVKIYVNSIPQEFRICYGGSEACTKSSCHEVSFMVGVACDFDLWLKEGAENE